MKKISLIVVFLFAFQMNFANVEDPLLIKAKEYSISENYKEAIKTYNKYLNSTKEVALKNVYVEMANCYFKLEKKEAAVEYIKKAITVYGFSEHDFIYNDVLDAELSKYALSVIYDELDDLSKKYNETQD
jgi:tetratricopeptide (TPR) repeat protein